MSSPGLKKNLRNSVLLDQLLLSKIVSAGTSGVKKAELKKEFGKECEPTLESLLKEDKVIVDQKGIAYFVWTKDNYLTHLSQNDPKYKIIFNRVKELESAIEQVKNTASQLAGKLNSKNDVEKKFKNSFDSSIKELASSSIGWIPFYELRKKVCDSVGINKDAFYSLATSLVVSNPDKYEASTGGDEGIMLRGMLHGYVRLLPQ